MSDKDLKAKKAKHKKIIVVGSERYYGVGVDAVSWMDSVIPNIADYHVVILNTETLGLHLKQAVDTTIPDELKEIYKRILNKNVGYIKSRLVHVLDSDGIVYAICSPRITVGFGSGRGWSALRDNYDWSPLPINMVEETGETIEVEDDTFLHYFQFVNKWFFYFDNRYRRESLRTTEQFYRDEYYLRLASKTIAENRYRKPLAQAIAYDLHLITEGKLPLEVKYKENPERTSGLMYLLPQPTQLSTEEGIGLLLEDFYGIEARTLPPAWVGEVSMPKVAELDVAISGRQEEINGLSSEISGLQKQKDELTRFKQLLYETGSRLEDICKLTLRELGGEIDDSVEDFVLRVRGTEAIVEVKGREGTIERKDGDQLARNRRNYAIEKEKGIKEIKAILFGNPWRLVPLKERIEKEAFARHLVEDAKVEGIALVATIELFKAYCALLDSKIAEEKIIDGLFSGVGVTKLVEE